MKVYALICSGKYTDSINGELFTADRTEIIAAFTSQEKAKAAYENTAQGRNPNVAEPAKWGVRAVSIYDFEVEARAAVPQAAAEPAVDAQFVLRVEDELGHGAGSWDMVDEAKICKAVLKVARAAAVPAPAQMDFWFKLADKVAQKYGVPFLQIDELGLFMQNEARHLLAGATAPPKEG